MSMDDRGLQLKTFVKEEVSNLPVFKTKFPHKSGIKTETLKINGTNVNRLPVKYFVEWFANARSETDQKPSTLSSEEWRCMYCAELFNTPNRLALHMKTTHVETQSIKKLLHSDRSTVKHDCKFCGTSTASLQYLVRHTLKVHGDEITSDNNDVVKDPRKCPTCRRVFSGEQGLRSHLLLIHSREVDVVDEAFKNFVEHQIKSTKSADLPTMVTLSNVGQRIPEVFMLKAGSYSGVVKKCRPKKAKLVDVFAFECNECKLNFASADMVDLHKNIRHTMYQCHLCLTWCQGRFGLDGHHKLMHVSTP